VFAAVGPAAAAAGRWIPRALGIVVVTDVLVMGVALAAVAVGARRGRRG